LYNRRARAVNRGFSRRWSRWHVLMGTGDRLAPQRLWVRTAVLAGIATMLRCSPTSPTKCVNGHDGYGRSPYVFVELTCQPLGSDVGCTAIHLEEGYCADG